MTEVDKEVMKLLDPILSVFAGEDGGLSFAILKNKFIPKLMEEPTNGSEQLLTMIKQFSRLCDMAYKRKI